MARPHRLSLAGCGLALLLAGCGDTPLADALRGPAAPMPGAVTSEPSGPVLLVTGARRPFRFMLLQDAGGQRLWRAEGGAALSTQGARITATAGLGAGPATILLAATRLEGTDPLDDPRALPGREARSLRSIDLQGATRSPQDLRFGVQLDCRMTAAAEGAWLLLTERCTGDGIAFTNRFWAEPASGAVRRSEQWVGDATLTVEAHGL
ncbi:YjbF family lipoprotein [Falsiroseomonas sp. E2-1-a20]|uniref:YjbF family lipoprotein n=1 Tax=Falsiroseomonas sp. E2-1-a20 TaxID=3239300 RepID=UPI003F3E1EFF